RRTTSSAAPARSTSVAATVTLKGIVIRGFHPKGKGKAPEEDDQEEEEIRVDPGEVPLPEADAEDDLEDHPTRPNPTPTLIPQSSWDLSKLERVLFLFLTRKDAQSSDWRLMSAEQFSWLWMLCRASDHPAASLPLSFFANQQTFKGLDAGVRTISQIFRQRTAIHQPSAVLFLQQALPCRPHKPSSNLSSLQTHCSEYQYPSMTSNNVFTD
ncbi:hypothetical protein E4T56_gene5302, partial [Termitomyces sp. T112]